MTGPYDLVVLGAGPAGSHAAMEAARSGLRVIVLDGEEQAGGQVYRAPTPARPRADADHDSEIGKGLRRSLSASRVECAFSHRVWHVEAGFRVRALSERRAIEVEGKSLIVATGALERHVPVPGWTLPGVIGLAAATILLKACGVVPGRQVVVAGAGPLLYLVGAAILKRGGKLAAIIDASPMAGWLARLPTMLRRPPALLRGAGWIAAIRAHGVPILTRHAINRIDGRESVERVTCAPVDDRLRPTGPSRGIDADALCYGFGLTPSTDVTRLLRASHSFDARLGGWVVRTDNDFATDVPGLYACGDCAGVVGAAAAPHSGQLAALAAMRDLGRISADAFASAAAPIRRRFAAAAEFGRAMTEIASQAGPAVPPGPPDTIMCRCESTTRAELERAIDAGSHTLNDLKAVTRCGMGPCGGRVCGEAAALLIQSRIGASREAIGQFTGRSPLFPVRIGDIAGELDYSQLPILQPAPL